MPAVMDTYVENRELVHPHHANTLGTAHGGNVLKWMDITGAMTAMRFAGERCATAQMDQVNFKQPIPIGQIAVVRAYVYDAGRTSVRIRVEVEREHPTEGTSELTTESYMVFVAIDDDHEPTPVPELTTETPEGERLRQDALDGEDQRHH